MAHAGYLIFLHAAHQLGFRTRDTLTLAPASNRPFASCTYFGPPNLIRGPYGGYADASPDRSFSSE